MNVTAATTSTSAPWLESAQTLRAHDHDRAQSAQGFAQALQAAAGSGEEAPLREAATELVASALLVPVLQTLQNSPLQAPGPFATNVVERRFGPVLHQHLADRIAQASNFPLVDKIVERFMPQPSGQTVDVGTDAARSREAAHG